ncbi:hypothetical protein LV83_04187 [Algoriphagus yeomjeoni]|uniref:Uncharacterized protein n=1 Tax=Algoriphagus yeomjeoni TaxID=291403 RepID=A0A327NWT1_9BACT|nr:hypothetical protein LV83_04187 [Algoriphagus yeomjeoni]
MKFNSKRLVLLIAVAIGIYGLIILRQDLANQSFNWTIENIFKYILITLASVGLYIWTYEKKENKK